MNGKSISLLLVFYCLGFPFQDAAAQDLNRYHFTDRQMGTLFRITFYAKNDSAAESAAQAAFHHLEKLNGILSDYEPGSNLNRLSARSGSNQYFTVHPALFRIISKAREVSRQTDGAFDITAGPFVQLWRSIRKAQHPKLPSGEQLDSLKKRVGHQYVKIDSSLSAVALTRPNMQLDPGGIAKGYAADEMLHILKARGMHSALIDAGGDIRAGNPPPGEPGWIIRIPVHNKAGQQTNITLRLANRAVASSGDLFQYVEIDGKRYSHIIDPQTGLGLTNRSRVTIIAPDGITADSYASAVSVLGAKRGQSFIQTQPGSAMRMEYHTQETGELTISISDSFNAFLFDP